MATLYYARTGLDPDRATRQDDFPAAIIVAKLGQFPVRYFSGPPEINPSDPSRPYGNPTLCVVHFEAEEVCTQFPKEGYYFFHDLTPQRCSSILGLA